MTDGLYGIGFGVANETNRSALNPASAIDTRDVRPALVQHPALVVSNNTLDIVKRDCIKFAPEIADRSIDSLNFKLSHLACCPDASGAIELRALKLNTRNLAIGANNLPWRREEVQV